MAQKFENFKFEGKYAEYIPAASTAISAGDAVMLTNGSLTEATATKATLKDFVGICDDNWNATVAMQRYGVASTDFATPTTRPVKLKVYHDGVFDLAIRETSGTAGQAVYLLTATTGVQIFTIDPISVAAETVMGPVGQLYETFSGATTADCQKVRITAGLQNIPRDIRWTLMNRLLYWNAPNGTNTVQHIALSDGTTVGATFPRVAAMVNGILVGIESDCTINAACAMPTGVNSGSCVVIFAFDSAGCVQRFYDSAKCGGAATRTTMRADQFYWPSVTTDYLPFALGFLGGTDSIMCSPMWAITRTYSDCLRVT
jgi:hypothetical protein